MYRSILRSTGKDRLGKEQLRCYALTPGPDGEPFLEIPTCWKLELSSAWLQSNILLLLERQ